ncbi:hypothetical protein D5085_10720 [Ectothiorhodospiraceae bacterium BW-2]|nr:hypothetical protein D5085_10720 [Ectothiorhodospiraceae bacterium BW-2]
MAKHLLRSNEHQSLDDIVAFRLDMVDGVTLLYQSVSQYERFRLMNRQELQAQKQARLMELGYQTTFSVLSAIEAVLKLDYDQRVINRLKDPLSREFRKLHKSKGHRILLEDDILANWQLHYQNAASVIQPLIKAFRFRHWLAHGRYWQPKFQHYDFDDVYILADAVLTQFPLKN